MLGRIIFLLFRAIFLLKVFKNERYRYQDTSKRNPDSQYTIKKKNALSQTELMKSIHMLEVVNVLEILDGDTLLVGDKNRDFLVRLDSIDCPENGQEWGDTAKYGLIKQIGGKIVSIEKYGFDPYGRVLATIHYLSQSGEWINVNERMVMLGHAWVLKKYYDHLPKDRRDKLNKLQEWAQGKKVGLWKQSNPTPPWEWRQNTSI
jgi:micrococcal nuclease